jgi:hypothetical protein
MRNTVLLLLALLLSGSAQALTAQRRSGAGGFWYSITVAPGWSRVSCDICAGRRETGISAFVGLGGTTSRALRLGGELAAWRQSDEGITQTLLSIGATANWYPGTKRRWYLRGGAMLLMHRANDGTDAVTSSGIGPQMGLGYESAAGRHWLIAPFVHYSIGVVGGNVNFNGGQAAGSARLSFLQAGVSLTHR